MNRSSIPAPAACEHSRHPDWENRLWMLAGHDLGHDEEEALMAEIEDCAYCRQHLAACLRAEAQAHRRAAPPRPAAGEQPEGLVRIVVRRIREGLESLEAGWTALAWSPAPARGGAVEPPGLRLQRTLGRVSLQFRLQPADEGRIQMALTAADADSGLPLEGEAELSTNATLLECVPVFVGQARFRAYPPGRYVLRVSDYSGMLETLELVFQ